MTQKSLFHIWVPNSSVGKESACRAGDPSSTPGLGRSAGEGIGYPLQYSWASLVAQLVKNPPAMGETRVQSLGGEDPLEKGKATHSSILVWRILSCKESDMTERFSLSQGFWCPKAWDALNPCRSCLWGSLVYLKCIHWLWRGTHLDWREALPLSIQAGLRPFLSLHQGAPAPRDDWESHARPQRVLTSWCRADPE